MGCCCSCLKGDVESNSETEMQTQPSRESKSLSISRAMTAPRIEIAEKTKVSGYGLALVGVTIEQDAAYWEGHIQIPKDEEVTEVMFGVATKKDRKFYNALEEQEEESGDTSGTDLMRKIRVKDRDVVGIAVQQSDLPMVQFLLNGEPLRDAAVNRFRGTVYPAVFLPENEGLSVKLVFNESEFRELSPHARFGPVIVARGLL